MLPQVFKWDDRSKSLITKQLDENKILTKCSEFIAQELGLATVNVVEFNSMIEEMDERILLCHSTPALVSHECDLNGQTRLCSSEKS